MKQGLVGFVCAGVFIASAAHANEYKELSANGGEINWTTAKITAQGYGKANDDANKKLAPLLACRAATVDAQRNLLETVQGTRITSVSTVNNFMLQSDEVTSSVEGVIKGARVIGRDIDRDKVCTITMSIDMNGPLAATIYKQENASDGQAFNWPTLDWPVEFAVNFSLFNQANAADIDTNWVETIEARLLKIEQHLMQNPSAKAPEPTAPTGLVIDARGSNFIPSLSPKVRELRGSVIYPDSNTKGSVINTGRLVSLFARDVDFALRHPKVGERPLLVKALRTYGDTRTEIILGKETSQKMREMVKTTDFADAGVIIVLD